MGVPLNGPFVGNVWRVLYVCNVVAYTCMNVHVHHVCICVYVRT